MRRYFVFLLFSIFLWMSCGRDQDDQVKVLPSPTFDIHLYFNLFKGNPYYMVYVHNDIVVNWSSLGFNPSMGTKFNENMIEVDPDASADSWAENEDSSNEFFTDVRFNTLAVQLVSTVDSTVNYTIEFRSFTGGIAFRYRFEQPGDRARLMPWEASEINFSDPGRIVQESRLSDSTEVSPFIFDLPLELITDKSHHIQIMEDPLPEFPGMKLKQDTTQELRFTTFIKNDVRDGEAKLSTPWRIVLLTKTETNE